MTEEQFTALKEWIGRRTYLEMVRHEHKNDARRCVSIQEQIEDVDAIARDVLVSQ